MTFLPTIRLIQGYYGSQWAMQYTAFIYLKEKLGVNVTFYPENDPLVLINIYRDYTDWCDIHDHNNCSQFPPYPTFYFEDIKNDKYDLLFEIWDNMIASANGWSYFDDGTVINGGFSGVSGDVGGWFVPRYVYNENPEWTLIKYLKYNKTVQQIFVDAFTINSDLNWYDKWWDIWNDTLDDYPFDLPVKETPIIFGSVEGYSLSKYSYRLSKNLMGVNWTFLAFGSEQYLLQFIQDIYTKRLPFIACLYSPSLDIAFIYNQTHGEYAQFQFERINLPRNPDNDVKSECYIDATCDWPNTPLYKLANPKIKQMFPEIYRFLVDFKMTATDVNEIINFQYELQSTNSANLSLHEQWLNASCNWLKQNEDTINIAWYQEITRYDCTGVTQCGYDYFYNSFYDAINGINIQSLPIIYHKNIAGYCLNDTYKPLCNCTNEFFIGDSCTESCPGLIGPINSETYKPNQSLNMSSINIGQYIFYSCNGHGNCDIVNRICSCHTGYTGNKCNQCSDGYYTRYNSNSDHIHCIECYDHDSGYECSSGSIIVSHNHWIGVKNYSFDSNKIFATTENENDSIIISSICPSNICCQKSKCSYNDSLSLCALNRDYNSILCGACVEGYSEVYGSDICKKCDNNVSAFVVVFFLALIYVLILAYDGSTIINNENENINSQKLSKKVKMNFLLLKIMVFRSMTYLFQTIGFICLQSGVEFVFLPILRLPLYEVYVSNNNNNSDYGVCFLSNLTAITKELWYLFL
eukprot:86653_1